MLPWTDEAELFFATGGARYCAPQQGLILRSFLSTSSVFGAPHHSDHDCCVLASQTIMRGKFY
jgi:hypothetical protein